MKKIKILNEENTIEEFEVEDRDRAYLILMDRLTKVMDRLVRKTK